MTDRWITCRVCKGAGTERIERGLAVMTLGLTALLQQGMSRPCPRCKGSGWEPNPNPKPKGSDHD